MIMPANSRTLMLVSVPSLFLRLYRRVVFRTSSGHSMYHQNFKSKL